MTVVYIIFSIGIAFFVGSLIYVSISILAKSKRDEQDSENYEIKKEDDLPSIHSSVGVVTSPLVPDVASVAESLKSSVTISRLVLPTGLRRYGVRSKRVRGTSQRYIILGK